MSNETYIYSVSGEPRLECLLSAVQLRQALAAGFIVRDNAAGIWRLTPAGHAELLAAEIAGEVDY